jgi:RNA recognition motif-containing protein
MQNIFIENLEITTTEQELRALFEPFGTVLSVRIVNDRDTQVPRGFAFVEMEDLPACERAVAALDGHMMDSRRISVNLARPKSVDPPGIEGKMRDHRRHRY